MANADETLIADGMPMSLTDMREYLQGHFGIPVVLRKQGTAAVKCPYCQEIHEHGPQPGHVVAGCAGTEVSGITIAVGDRYFIPAYGYSILEYKDCGDRNELLFSTRA